MLVECGHPLYWILPSPDDPGWRSAPRSPRMVDEHRLMSPRDSRTNNLFPHVPVYFTPCEVAGCSGCWWLFNNPVLVMSQHALLFLMTSQEQVYQCWWLCITNRPIVRGVREFPLKPVLREIWRLSLLPYLLKMLVAWLSCRFFLLHYIESVIKVWNLYWWRC